MLTSSDLMVSNSGLDPMAEFMQKQSDKLYIFVKVLLDVSFEKKNRLQKVVD